MASLSRCTSCRGFLPSGLVACPNCGASEPASTPVSTLADRLGFLLKVTGGASVAMTLMACYGVPYDPNDPTDTDPTEGTSAGETEPATGSTGAAESTGAPAESSTSAAESTGASESGGSESGGSDGSSSGGGGAVDQPSLPR